MKEHQKNCWYYGQLKKTGLLSKAEDWLRKNPKPKKWEGCRWSYAYTEMPVFWW
jgi:hypothetical protein